MNMFCRILIVIGNLLVVPIMLPIAFVLAVRGYIKKDMKSYGMPFTELIGAFIDLLKYGFHINIEFLKTGDLELFRDAFNE